MIPAYYSWVAHSFSCCLCRMRYKGISRKPRIIYTHEGTTEMMLWFTVAVALLLVAPTTSQQQPPLFSVQFIPYQSSSLDPSRGDFLQALQVNINVFLYPTTYSTQSTPIEFLNYTEVCDASLRCTASAIVVLTGTNKTAQFAALQQTSVGPLAVDLGIHAIAFDASLYGTFASTAPSDTSSQTMVYAIAIPVSFLVVAVMLWVGLRCYATRHKPAETMDAWLAEQERQAPPPGYGNGEELISRERLMA